MVIEAIAVSREEDDLFDACFRAFWNVIGVELQQRSMVVDFIKGSLNTAEAVFGGRKGGDGAGAAEFRHFESFFWGEKVDPLNSELATPIGEFEEGGVFKTPAANRMLK